MGAFPGKRGPRHAELGWATRPGSLGACASARQVQVGPVDSASVIEILLAELRRLRAEGVESVPMGPESESRLRELLAGARGPAGSSPSSAPVAARPSPVQPAPARHGAEPARSSPDPAVAKPRAPAPEADPLPDPPVVELPAGGSRSERWAALRERLEACPEARRRRRQGAAAFAGHGTAEPDLLVVAEHPDEHEELTGDPFAGPSGEILGKALRAMGLGMDRVHLTYVVRWRPVLPSRLGTRPATAREVAYCLPYLRAQVAALAPKAVVALGKGPLNALAAAPEPLLITRERGVWREAMGVALLPTFQPSYLLHNPSNKAKREFWEDLLSVMERLGLPISERQRGFYR